MILGVPILKHFRVKVAQFVLLLKCMGTASGFSTIFTKGNNFCDF